MEIVEETLINLTIRMIHGMLFDPDTDNKELYDIRTKIDAIIKVDTRG